MKTLKESLFDQDLARKKPWQIKLLDEVQQTIKDYSFWELNRDYDLFIYEGGSAELFKEGYRWDDDDYVLVIKPLKKTRSYINLQDIVTHVRQHLDQTYHGSIFSWWINPVADHRSLRTLFISINKYK